MQKSKKIIYEFDIQLQDGSKSHPDLFCLLTENEDFYYSLIEFKRRTATSTEDIEEKIKPQYTSFQNIKIDDLDDLLIPKIQNADIYVNYIFYNSDPTIITQIINSIPIQSDVYQIDLDHQTMVSIQSTTGNFNHQLMIHIIKLSQEEEFWNKIYVPFTYDDIQYFRGRGGREVDIHNKSGIILTSNFLMFILSRKIKSEDSSFLVDDFIKYVFQNNFTDLNIGWEHRATLERKFRLFLRFLSDEIPTRLEIKPIIERAERGYRILLRNTDTLEKRIIEITNEVIEYLKQRRISEWLE